MSECALLAARARAGPRRVDRHDSCTVARMSLSTALDTFTLDVQSEISSLQRLVASHPPRASLAVLAGALDDLAFHLVRHEALRAEDIDDIDELIEDAAVIFDDVAGARAVCRVLDHELRPLAERVVRVLDDVERDAAARLALAR